MQQNITAPAMVPALERDSAPLNVRVAVLGAVLLPLLGFVGAAWSLWGWGFSWLYLTMLVVMYLASGLGITIGYHRLFTHKSFETGRFMTLVFGVLGSMAVEGPVIKWVADHRKHHQHSDDEHDPHSPHAHADEGIRGVLRGFWHAHLGWLFQEQHPDFDRYTPDLHKDRLVRVISALFPVWVLLGLAVPAAVGGLVSGTWTGAALGLLWGGLARIFLVHHVTWSVNSVCHIWGKRDYKTTDHSRNNVLFGVLAMGEGWHNNHHAFPASARHGLEWWQFDLSYVIIRGLEMVGLARRVRVPSLERRAMMKR